MLRPPKSGLVNPHHPPSVPTGTSNVWWAVFFVWNSGCIAVVVHLIGQIPEASTDVLYVYYQPAVPIVVMLWLWGVNVGFFQRAGIEYESLFGAEERR